MSTKASLLLLSVAAACRLSSPASGQALPEATTLAVTDIISVATEAGATLNGSVDPGGLPTAAWFEYGTSHEFAARTVSIDAGSGTGAVAVDRVVTGLTAGLTYRCRLVASNSLGMARGADEVFWSPAVILKGPNPFSNGLNEPFSDPGATVSGSPLAIAGGYQHSVARRADNTVTGWGWDYYGQTNVPAGATGIVAVAAGAYHNVALRDDGAVIGWGRSTEGQLAIPAGATNAMDVAAGLYHCLSLRGDGTVIAWGGNDFGQTNTPSSATNVVGACAGRYHSLALRADGTIVGWGRGVEGQTSVPAGSTNATAVSAGSYHSLALKEDGTVIGWGYAGFGLSVIPPAATGVVAIAAGGYHNLALRADGSVIGWGRNLEGQTTVQAGATNIAAIAAGLYHSLALRADGAVIGWGGNAYGQTNAPPDLGTLNLPVAVDGEVGVDTPGVYEVTYITTNALGAVASVTRTVVVAGPPPVIPGGAGQPAVTNGLFAFDVEGVDGQVVVVEASTDLALWTPVHTNLVGTLESFLFYDLETGDFARRFYRARLYIGAVPPPGMIDGEHGPGIEAGQFHGAVGALGGQDVVIEASTNLVSWVPIETNTAAIGPLEFSDPAATNFGRRFYRAVAP